MWVPTTHKTQRKRGQFRALLLASRLLVSRLPGSNLARGADSWGRLVGSVWVVESDLFGVFGLLVGLSVGLIGSGLVGH
jgi:hypothetical protein